MTKENVAVSNTKQSITPKPSKVKGQTGQNTVTYVVLVVGAIISLFPFAWMLSTSLKPGGALLEIPPSLIPDPVMWSNYAEVWVEQNFARYTFNSALITVLEMIGMLMSCALVGYGLAVFKFRGQSLIFAAMIATLVLPGQVTLIPHYFIWKSLGMVNTFYPLILPAYFAAAFGAFLMRQYYKSLPKELYDAAWVDGANPFQIFYKIYLPLGIPALATLGIFTFINAWNNTIGPLIYLQDKELYTLPLALLFLKNDNYTDMTVVMAGAVITTIPVVIVFLLAQKYFIRGIASGGLKG